MDEIVKAVAEKTGLPEEMARTAVTMVVNFVKAKLPRPIASQLDGLIAGDVNPDDLLKGGGGLLGGLFGKK